MKAAVTELNMNPEIYWWWSSLKCLSFIYAACFDQLESNFLCFTEAKQEVETEAETSPAERHKNCEQNIKSFLLLGIPQSSNFLHNSTLNECVYMRYWA